MNISRDLSEDSKAKITADIAGVSHELKLKEFVRRSRSLFKESEHQQYLKSLGLSNVWDFKTRTTWIMFCNAVLMNILLLGYLGTRSKESNHYAFKSLTPSHFDLSTISLMSSSTTESTGDTLLNVLYINPIIDDLLEALNALQVLLSAITLSIHFLGSMPVKYSTYVENGNSIFQAATSLIFDPLSIWYTVYFCFTLFGLIFKNRLWLTLLLLDWVVLDSTTQNLLLAVQYPARQLFATLIIIFIFVHIFSAIYFQMYRSDVLHFEIFDLWESFKMTFSYGTRGEVGISEQLFETLGPRTVFDIAFYFIVSIPTI